MMMRRWPVVLGMVRMQRRRRGRQLGGQQRAGVILAPSYHYAPHLFYYLLCIGMYTDTLFWHFLISLSLCTREHVSAAACLRRRRQSSSSSASSSSTCVAVACRPTYVVCDARSLAGSTRPKLNSCRLAPPPSLRPFHPTVCVCTRAEAASERENPVSWEPLRAPHSHPARARVRRDKAESERARERERESLAVGMYVCGVATPTLSLSLTAALQHDVRLRVGR